MRRFVAPWDRSLKISTALVGAVLVGVGVGVPALIAASGEGADRLVLLLPAGISLLVAALAAALAPRAFAIEGPALRVERPLFPVTIPLRPVRAVALLPPGATRGALRLAGTSGFFGHYGRFRSAALGAFRLYATRRDGLVLLDTDAERFVLSPRDPERFAEAVLAVAPNARRGADRLPEAAAPKGGRLVGVLLPAVAIAGAFL
ncbi:MAG TPA: PH domain-containing protein, partial [Anaeromyxobacteraceae bacterium]|nr:PH domain-containing protein [Anaeromyxobacteraceae bacterium]